MTLEKYGLLRHVLTYARPGQPLTSAWLAEQGVSPQLAYHYVQAGWLIRLGHGWFLRASSDKPELLLSLAALSGTFHIGGKTALAWHGYHHNLAHRAATELFAQGPFRLPEWMQSQFPRTVRKRRLFDDDAQGVAPWRYMASLRVAEPERAVLEMLWGVPQHQTLEEATHLVESLFGLRATLMQPLLESCRNIKAVRLFLNLAKQASLPVMEDLDMTRITGSAAPYVRRHATATIRT